MRWLLLAAPLWLVHCGETGRERCRAENDRVEECGLPSFGDDCRHETDFCRTECSRGHSCQELGAERLSLELSRCFATCVEWFTCEDDGSRIRASWTCDGERDCVDGSDEVDCEHFECEDGTRIHRWQRCSGRARCPDGSDEAGCFECEDGWTIDPHWVCDGYEDCEGGEDELEC